MGRATQQGWGGGWGEEVGRRWGGQGQGVGRTGAGGGARVLPYPLTISGSELTQKWAFTTRNELKHSQVDFYTLFLDSCKEWIYILQTFANAVQSL